MKVAVYPGSFDPITYGHLDVLERALKVFDKVIVLIADNPDKKYRFTIEDRLEMIKETVKDMKSVEVDYTSGLTVEYAKECGASCLIRGLRAVTDFEYEFSLAAANEYIDSSVDEVFFMSHAKTSFISSSTIDGMYKNGVDISKLVPPAVLRKYQNK